MQISMYDGRVTLRDGKYTVHKVDFNKYQDSEINVPLLCWIQHKYSLKSAFAEILRLPSLPLVNACNRWETGRGRGL